MIYEYMCQTCGDVEELPFFAKIGYPATVPPGEPNEGATLYCHDKPMLRAVSRPMTQPTGGMYPYFNHNIGSMVESDRDYQRLLREKADKNTQLTGTDHNYVPVYPGDLNDDRTMAKLGVGAGADRGESIELSRKYNHRSWKPSTAKTIDLGG